MSRDPRFDILFEPVRIGPVTAPNRFYQVPHASGMTNANPRMRAAFRAMKAEGGWGVVCTGACSIDPSSDDSPFPCATLWDDTDVRAHALMTEAVHGHGALAGVELWHGGAATMNRATRLPPLSPSGVAWMATHVGFMGQQRPRIMDKADIRALIGWQKAAAARAKQAGFDIVYVYAGMGYLPHQFLLSHYNFRTDEYGGPVKNRVRLARELLDATREAVGGACAVALRISLQELRATIGTEAESEAHEVVALLDGHLDLWDVKLDYSATDCGASRFRPEGAHEPVIDFVKTIAKKPVVGVGRFTSPDAMVSQIKRGVLDLIGAARPSIADPFLPRKIAEGRADEIRECIGCNICIASWHDGVPVRCTQNPTAGEEWQRGWHPERVANSAAGRVLVVGGGPAGMEAALTLARRGFDVAVADQADELGGRVRFERALPGLSAWGRTVDYRLGRLRAMNNVRLYPGSAMTADDALDFGADHVVLATGARWLPNLWSTAEIAAGTLDGPGIHTPTDLARGAMPEGPVTVFDFDNYYMGSAVAELLAGRGLETHYVTPAGMAANWTINTNELPFVHEAFGRLNIALHTLSMVTGFDGATVSLQNIFTRAPAEIVCRSLVIVGHRAPETALHDELAARDVAAHGIATLNLTGDASAPGGLAHAIHQAHGLARRIGADPATLTVKRDSALVPA